MEISTFIEMAIIIEALISWGDTLFVDKHFQPKVLISFIFGVILALNFKFNLFSVVGLEESYPIVGYLITGVLVSRGSNYAFEIFDRLTNWKATDVK